MEFTGWNLHGTVFTYEMAPEIRKAVNPLTLNPYFTKSLPCAEALDGVAAERNKRFFPKITARLVYKIKS